MSAEHAALRSLLDPRDRVRVQQALAHGATRTNMVAALIAAGIQLRCSWSALMDMSAVSRACNPFPCSTGSAFAEHAWVGT